MAGQDRREGGAHQQFRRFEAQIDEQGRPNYHEKHRTGAIYDVSTGEVIGGRQEPRHQHFQAGPVLEPGVWHDYEVEVAGDRYVVRLKPHGAAAYQEVTAFTKTAGQYTGRGLPPSADRRSGYVGIQAALPEKRRAPPLRGLDDGALLLALEGRAAQTRQVNLARGFAAGTGPGGNTGSRGQEIQWTPRAV